MAQRFSLRYLALVSWGLLARKDVLGVARLAWAHVSGCCVGLRCRSPVSAFHSEILLRPAIGARIRQQAMHPGHALARPAPVRDKAGTRWHSNRDMNVATPSFSLAYCTNIWSHHQAPVCTELAHLLGQGRFTMCLFEPVDEERRTLGWGGAAPQHTWVAGPPSASHDRQQLEAAVCSADVAVLGACPREVHAARAATGEAHVHSR